MGSSGGEHMGTYGWCAGISYFVLESVVCRSIHGPVYLKHGILLLFRAYMR